MVWSQLPEVALAKVFGYLPLSDQLSARRICKYWQMVNDSYVPRRELILFINILPRPIYWQHDQQAAELTNGLMVNDLLLENEFFWVYFRKIQRLMLVFGVHSSWEQPFERIQASFTDLQHLQFSSVGYRVVSSVRKKTQSEFRLENLRTLYSYDVEAPLNLNCPNLIELFIVWDLTIDESTNEQTKKCLQNLKLLRVRNLTYPLGFEFTKLEVLHVQKLPISLIDFPMLKELHLLTLHDSRGNGVHFEELLQQKKRLKREHLRIFYQGFDMEGRNYSDITPYGYNFKAEDLRLAKERPSSCDFRLERKSLDLRDSSDDELIGLREGELPECLFKSIMDLEIKGISKVRPAFFEICDRFPYIQSIVFYSEVSQAFLDRLPDVLPRLASFMYRPIYFQNKLIIFDFVARFKYLYYFTAWSCIASTEKLRLALENRGVLEDVAFGRAEERDHEKICLWISSTKG